MNAIWFCKLKKFDVKIDVIPNRLEKYITFILNKDLLFIDCMQFMNSSLEKLVKNLTDDDIKYLTEEFRLNNLELLKQKDAYPCEYVDIFKEFIFYSSVKDKITGDNSEKLDGHISDED